MIRVWYLALGLGRQQPAGFSWPLQTRQWPGETHSTQAAEREVAITISYRLVEAEAGAVLETLTSVK